MTLDAHNQPRKSPKKKRTTILTIVFGILAIPSSLAGINEFTNVFTSYENQEPIWCETGIRDGWYKNCEYEFQFDLPTQDWTIVDSNSKSVLHNYNIQDDDFWLQFNYDFGEQGSNDARGFIVIGKLYNFDVYEQLVVENIQEQNNLSDINHSRENGQIKFNYKMFEEHTEKTFDCVEIHDAKYRVVFFIQTCAYYDGINVDYVKPPIYHFWNSFRFF